MAMIWNLKLILKQKVKRICYLPSKEKTNKQTKQKYIKKSRKWEIVYYGDVEPETDWELGEKG